MPANCSTCFQTTPLFPLHRDEHPPWPCSVFLVSLSAISFEYPPEHRLAPAMRRAPEERQEKTRFPLKASPHFFLDAAPERHGEEGPSPKG